MSPNKHVQLVEQFLVVLRHRYLYVLGVFVPIAAIFGTSKVSARVHVLTCVIMQMGSPVKQVMGGALEASRSMRARTSESATTDPTHADVGTSAAAAVAAADAFVHGGHATATGVHSISMMK